MSDRKGTKRTNIYIPVDLHTKVKDAGINLSDFVRKSLEHEFYGDNPRFIECKLNDALRKKQDIDRSIKLYKQDLEKATQKQEERKKRIGSFNPLDINDHRTLTPKDKGAK